MKMGTQDTKYHYLITLGNYIPKIKVHQRGISGERWKYKAKIQRI